MSLLASWSRGEHTADGTTHPTYRKGRGTGVIVIHELPGMTPDVIAFADEVVARGHTVVMPHLFGEPEAPPSARSFASTIPKVCVSREFTMLAAGRASPAAVWLRSLARDLHADVGGPGVGAVGMCLTGGFALAMMVDPSVVAPVVAQPSLPFAIGRRRSADLGLSPADLDAVKRRAASGCPVLGLRYAADKATGTRFATLHHELGDDFIAVEFEGKGHSTLTEHRQQEGVDRVLDFFDDRLARPT
jgi:dienelactone hydrolase